MLNIPPHLEACRPRGLFSIFHGTSSPVARRCPRASDLVLSAEHAFLLYERPGLHLQSGASAVGGVLRGVRLLRGRPATDRQGISIHAPRVGCDIEDEYTGYCLNISIHAPRAGCDSSSLPNLSKIFSISIHAPRVGRDHGTRADGRGRTISIRASRAGCDRLTRFRLTTHENFNPRTPCGARRELIRPRYMVWEFQSTRPVWGATIHLPIVRPNRKYFNPRTPCGVRRSHPAKCRKRSLFQSTHPVRGATKYMLRDRDDLEIV